MIKKVTIILKKNQDRFASRIKSQDFIRLDNLIFFLESRLFFNHFLKTQPNSRTSNSHHLQLL
jgi:hypothetical protein